MRSWPHAPARVSVAPGAVIVTAGTYGKQPFFATDERLSLLQSCIFRHAEDLGWRLQAWFVGDNHYHFVALTPETPDLKRLMKRIHASSANEINKLDGTTGRMVWYRYWDTQLTFEKSYLARLAYVHSNAVKHGLVSSPEEYPYCSAAWFRSQAEAAFYETVMSFKTDRVNVYDDF